MHIVNPENAPKISPTLDVRKLFSGEKADLVHLTLKEGEFIAKHDNPIDVIFYILAGKAKLLLDNEIFNLNANDCIAVNTGVQRSMENSEKEDLKILVYKMKN